MAHNIHDRGADGADGGVSTTGGEAVAESESATASSLRKRGVAALINHSNRGGRLWTYQKTGLSLHLCTLSSAGSGDAKVRETSPMHNEREPT